MITQEARKSDKYIRFDERHDVVTSFDLLALLSTRVKKSPQYWKWIIVPAQSAIQGSHKIFLGVELASADPPTPLRWKRELAPLA
jgi:hypothetical protein